MKRVINLISCLLIWIPTLGCQTNNDSSHESSQTPQVSLDLLFDITSKNESTYLVSGGCNVELGAVTVTIGEPNVTKSLTCQDNNTFSDTFSVINVASNPASISVRQGDQVTTVTVANLMNRFVTRWSFTSGQRFTLPLQIDSKYDFSVDWGDGSEVNEVNSFNDLDKNHTYEREGEYIITITGLCEGFRNSGSFDKNLIEVINLGNMGWKDLSEAFDDNTNLTRISGGETSQVTNMNSMFGGITNINLSRLRDWDVSGVTNMSGMFNDTTSIGNLDLSQWDTSNVTNIEGIFYDLTAPSLNISGWNLSSVTNLNDIFEELNVDNLNVSHLIFSNAITDIESMFSSVTISDSLNAIAWDTSSVTDMSHMFYQANINNLNLNDWDISSVIDMSQMFFESNLNVDVSGWNTSSTTNMSHMFSGAANANPNTKNWDFSSVTSIQNIFNNATGLSVENYSIFLKSVASSINSNVAGRIGGDNAIPTKYNPSAVSARQTLVDQGWTINDGGISE